MFLPPLFPWQVQLFINCLLASADYDSFFSVMKKEAQKSLRQKLELGEERKPTGGEEKEQGRSSSVPPGGEGKNSETRRPSDDRPYK